MDDTERTCGVISINVHLREVAIHSDKFDGDGPPFTTVRVSDDAGNDVTLFVNAQVAATALALADALRAAALSHMPTPAQEPTNEAVTT